MGLLTAWYEHVFNVPLVQRHRSHLAVVDLGTLAPQAGS
jgi:hypothetical protein